MTNEMTNAVVLIRSYTSVTGATSQRYVGRTGGSSGQARDEYLCEIFIATR